ncbi:adenylate kinase 7 [Protopterus annectens]|uniref:adenylate kinase 7 n=1 Tax=Protopterus annectens TaxID=7888 RepID=UPI001CFB7E13|nr:adenylate kinase 7 [Protopterus annectens]
MAGEEKTIIRNKRVFLNHLDSYTCRNIALYLSNCVVGASLEDAGGEEEEGEGEESDKQNDVSSAKPKEGTFQIVGTLAKSDSVKPDFALETYMVSRREELMDRLLECDIIIYNITDSEQQLEEATWAVSAMHAEIERFENPKMFILLSTVMTWARSKPVDPDDPDIPFTEDDYRRRRPHPNFKEHISTEKLVIKLGKINKSKLTTYVIASGIQYGMEEDMLHLFFKMAWHGEVPALPVFGDGTNFIPMIHIFDLAAVVQNVVDHKPKTHYLVAVDDSKHLLREVVKCISSKLGTGKVQRESKENALLKKELTQNHIDHLLVNLQMEAVYIKENFNIRWMADTGFVENVEKVIKEYKHSRRLLPVKICILGPPAVGKSTVVEKLCKHYKLHHIKIMDVINEAIAKLERLVKAKEQAAGNEEEEEGEEEEEEDGSSDAAEVLESVKENMEQNGGRLDDQYLIKFVREKLKSMPCQNQGYILDGFPKMYEQGKELFLSEEEEEEEESRSNAIQCDKAIIPEYVIALDAPDDFLKNRVMNLPESVVAGTHYTQDRFIRRLNLFRDINTEDETVLNYFDELEIHPQHIDVTKDNDPEYTTVIDEIVKCIGKPRNYGLTPEEKAELEFKATEEKLRREFAKKAEMEQKEALEAAERAAHWEEWNKRLEEVKKQEVELLEAHSVPLRNYLMKNVMPTLTHGLIECCKVRPDDPVDFLAEYLFQKNPQVE